MGALGGIHNQSYLPSDKAIKWSKAHQQWCAKTIHHGAKYTLGYFPTQADALNAYIAAILAKKNGTIVRHLQHVGARVMPGSRGRNRPKPDLSRKTESPPRRAPCRTMPMGPCGQCSRTGSGPLPRRFPMPSPPAYTPAYKSGSPGPYIKQEN